MSFRFSEISDSFGWASSSNIDGIFYFFFEDYYDENI